MLNICVDQNQLSKSQEELLRKTGCVCTSSILQFSTTDNDLLKKYREQFGIYEFQVNIFLNEESCYSINLMILGHAQ